MPVPSELGREEQKKLFTLLQVVDMLVPALKTTEEKLQRTEEKLQRTEECLNELKDIVMKQAAQINQLTSELRLSERMFAQFQQLEMERQLKHAREQPRSLN
jgi:NAD(P)H-nitrite reductase large subunit